MLQYIPKGKKLKKQSNRVFGENQPRFSNDFRPSIYAELQKTYNYRISHTNYAHVTHNITKDVSYNNQMRTNLITKNHHMQSCGVTLHNRKQNDASREQCRSTNN